MNAKTIAAWILGGGVGVTILAAAMQFWISMNVQAQLAGAGIVPESTVTAIQTRVENLEAEHDGDILRVESKAERIAQILMEE
jgi:hypothetical protein